MFRLHPFELFTLAQRIELSLVSSVVEDGGLGREGNLERCAVLGDHPLLEEVVHNFDRFSQRKRPPSAGDGVRAKELLGCEEHVA